MARSFWDLLLSQGGRSRSKEQDSGKKSFHRDQKRRTPPPGFSNEIQACLLISNHSSHQPNRRPRMHPFNQTKAAIWYSDRPSFSFIQKKTFLSANRRARTGFQRTRPSRRQFISSQQRLSSFTRFRSRDMRFQQRCCDSSDQCHRLIGTALNPQPG